MTSHRSPDIWPSEAAAADANDFAQDEMSHCEFQASREKRNPKCLDIFELREWNRVKQNEQMTGLGWVVPHPIFIFISLVPRVIEIRPSSKLVPDGTLRRRRKYSVRR